MKFAKWMSFVLILILLLFSGCGSNKASKTMKAQQKKEAQRKKQEAKAYRQMVQDHQKRQADDTRRMIKQREKEGKRLNKNLQRKRF